MTNTTPRQENSLEECQEPRMTNQKTSHGTGDQTGICEQKHTWAMLGHERSLFRTIKSHASLNMLAKDHMIPIFDKAKYITQRNAFSQMFYH